MAVTPSTPKSERTRERIRDAAFELFAEKGFAATTMRDIAARADVSLGLTYRYFARKEDLAMALYSGMSARLRDTAAGLSGGSLADRFDVLMHATVSELNAHREAFLAVAARAFDPADDIGVLGSGTLEFRQAAQDAWRVVVDGADDRPADPVTREQLAASLYAWDLLVVLIWTQDRDPARAATHEAISSITGALRMLRLVLAMPFGTQALAQVASIATKLGIAPGR